MVGGWGAPDSHILLGTAMEGVMSDLGLTHIALPVRNVSQSIDFYAKYGAMQVVHRRMDQTSHSDVVWLSDLTRPFVIVLIQVPQVDHRLLPLAHLGVGCQTRAEVDRLCQAAQLEGVLREGPHDAGYPVGYWAFLADPDGHTLEVSHGQEIVFTVQNATVKAAQADRIQSPHSTIQEQLILQAAAAWISGDGEAFASLFIPEGEFIVPGNRWIGTAAICQVTTDFAAAYTGLKIEIRRIIVNGEQAVVEWHWQEVDRGTGKEGAADDTIVIDFQDGKISRWREYIDTQSCMKPRYQ
jgi:uncharacterized protein (TIGR02246 family)